MLTIYPYCQMPFVSAYLLKDKSHLTLPSASPSWILQVCSFPVICRRTYSVTAASGRQRRTAGCRTRLGSVLASPSPRSTETGIKHMSMFDMLKHRAKNCNLMPACKTYNQIEFNTINRHLSCTTSNQHCVIFWQPIQYRVYFIRSFHLLVWALHHTNAPDQYKNTIMQLNMAKQKEYRGDLLFL